MLIQAIKNTLGGSVNTDEGGKKLSIFLEYLEFLRRHALMVVFFLSLACNLPYLSLLGVDLIDAFSFKNNYTIYECEPGLNNWCHF